MVDQDDAGFVPVNVRAPEQWRIISAAYDVSGKRVLDVGCGYGDLLLYAARAGAQELRGIDSDAKIISQAMKRCIGKPILLYWADLLGWLTNRPGIFHYDAAFCMSVLPYVDAYRALRLLRRRVDTLIVECQYEGDGPGIVPGPEAMRHLLQAAGWTAPRRIGSTLVVDRNKERDIWLCK